MDQLLVDLWREVRLLKFLSEWNTYTKDQCWDNTNRDCSFLLVFEGRYHLSLTDQLCTKNNFRLGWGTLDRAGTCYLHWKKGPGVIPLALDTEVRNWKSEINLVSSYSHISVQPQWMIQPTWKTHEVFIFLHWDLVQFRPPMPYNKVRLGHFTSFFP